MRNQKKTRSPPKKYAKVYLVRLLELFLLRVGELLFLLRLFVDGHFYCYRVCVRVCVRVKSEAFVKMKIHENVFFFFV